MCVCMYIYTCMSTCGDGTWRAVMARRATDSASMPSLSVVEEANALRRNVSGAVLVRAVDFQ